MITLERNLFADSSDNELSVDNVSTSLGVSNLNDYLNDVEYVEYSIQTNNVYISSDRSVSPAIFSNSFYEVNILYNTANNVDGFTLLMNTFEVECIKINQLSSDPISIDINANDVELISQKIKEGLYTKDSSNSYSLYVNQGITYFATIDTEPLGFNTIEGFDISGYFSRDYQSTNRYNFSFEIIDNTHVKIIIPQQISNGLGGRYIFNINVEKNGNYYRLLDGYVIISGLTIQL